MREASEQSKNRINRYARNHFGLPLLPPTAMPWRAAARSRRRAEFGAGLAGVGGLDHLAGAAERFDGFRDLGTVGQGFRTVHFVEMGFVDFGA